MDLALTEFDEEANAVLEPSALIRGNRAPEAVVICFFREVVDELLAEGAERIDRTGMLHDFGVSVLVRSGDIGVLFPGVGAPLAVAALEETIAREHGASSRSAGRGPFCPI
ncbi:MAG: hypothetical protein ACLGHT_12665 [Acidimicrobiia bacterium]